MSATLVSRSGNNNNNNTSQLSSDENDATISSSSNRDHLNNHNNNHSNEQQAAHVPSQLLPPEIRGLLGIHGDSTSWINVVSKFPNGVPRFSNKEDCITFMKEYNATHGGSNVQHPHLQHIFTLIVGWEQITSLLLPAIEKARLEQRQQQQQQTPMHQSLDATESKPTNIYEQPECSSVIDSIEERLNVSFHRCTTIQSTMNTFKYLYYHMKFGIYIKIQNSTLRIFAPFVNIDYVNTWSQQLTIDGDGTLDTYYTQKAGLYREEQIEYDKSKWWANGNIICNEPTKMEDRSKSQHWGDHFLSPLRDMLGEACRLRTLPDCEFFLNKRDYPQLKVNVTKNAPKAIPVEPYGFIYDKDDRDPEQDIDLVPEHTFTSYAPIVSFYAAAPDRFTDLPFPSSEDWEAACGLVFPHTFIHTKNTSTGEIEMNGNPRDLFTEGNFRQFERSWDDGRVATAFFRGTATGGGTTVDNNQRLKVASLSYEWKDDPIKGGTEPYLDAAIVGWNLRDKKIADAPMSFLRATNFPFTAGRHHFTPIYEQSKYKYLVYVDGHCAACRYGFMMRLGSVILKVEPRQVADRMWYFPLLVPYKDHIPVKADLTDLEEKIRWCREHDDECRQIGENAKIFYEKYVARDALLDYIEMICKQVAKRFVPPPDWWAPSPTIASGQKVEPPKLRKPDVPCYEDRQSGMSRLCVRCREDADEEIRELELLQAQKTHEKVDAATKRKRNRDRMLKKAKETKKAKT